MSDKKNNPDEEYFFEEEVGEDSNDMNDFFSNMDDEGDVEDKTKQSESTDRLDDETSETDVKDDLDGFGVSGEFDDEEVGDNDETGSVSDSLSKIQPIINSVKEFVDQHTRVVAVAGAAVVALIAFQIFHSSGSEKQAFVNTPAITVVASPAAAPVVVKQVSAASKQELSVLHGQLANGKSQIAALQQRLTSLSNRQKDSEAVTLAMTDKLQTVTASNQQLGAEVALLRKQQQDRDKKRIYKKTHYVHYHVQALEEGRAWVMGSNGFATTLSVGNTLPHYGKVLTIDVDHGVIVMSSGENIKYKPQVSNAATK